MSVQAVIKCSNIPQGLVTEFGTFKGVNYLTILDGEDTRHLTTQINPADDSTEVVIDYNPNKTWLHHWAISNGVPYTVGA